MMRPAAIPTSLLAAALAVVLVPGPAAAEPGDSDKTERASDEDRAIARRHFLRGKELHADGKYTEAAAAYREAYAHFPAPAFLYNVAQVYRLAGDREAAIEYYRKYLDLEPDGEGSEDAREFLAALEAAPAGDGESSSEPSRSSGPVDAGRTELIDPIQRDTSTDDLDIGGSPGRTKKIIGTAIGAAGVVALGVGIGFGFKARSTADELTDYRGAWTEDQEQTFQDGESAERTALIGAAIGAAGIATGAIIFYLGHRDARRAAARRHRAAGVELGVAAGGSDSAFVTIRGAF